MGVHGELYPEFTMCSASDSWLGVLRGVFPGVRFQDWLGARAAGPGQLRHCAAERSRLYLGLHGLVLRDWAMMDEWTGLQGTPDQSGLKRSPRGHPNGSPLIFFPGNLDFNGLRPRAEDKGSRQRVARSPGVLRAGTRLVVEEQEEARAVPAQRQRAKPSIASPVITAVMATTDAPQMQPCAKPTDSHCPRTPEEVGTASVPLSGWRTEVQKDELSQKNRATHQTQAP